MNNILILLDSNNKKHIYVQIYDYIRKEIKEGKLRFGERLPSTRLLAQQLMISRSTVELAYEQLVSEGYLEARPYRGYYVCNMEEIYVLDSYESKGIENSNTNESMMTPEIQYQYDFSPNTIDISLFPFDTWKRTHKMVLLDQQEHILKLGDPKGEYELRKTICHYLHSFRGVNCIPEQIIIGAGNDYLLLLLQRILGPQKCIAMENATYMRAYHIFKSGGYEIRITPMDDSGMCANSLYENGADIAYVMPAHQFPTGVVMPIRRRMELLAWAAAEPGRYLIEDDYDSEFRYRGKPIPALQSSDQNGKVIYIGTFSKSIAPAIRISYMVLPQNLLESFQKNCGFLSSTVSRIDQEVLNTFISDGYFERYLNKMRKQYRTKHDIVMENLEPLQQRFQMFGESAGLHVLLRPKDGSTEEELIDQARKKYCKIYGMSAYQIEKKDNPTILLGYAAMQQDEIKNGIQALKESWL